MRNYHRRTAAGCRSINSVECAISSTNVPRFANIRTIRLNLPESHSLRREYPVTTKSTVFSTLFKKMNLVTFGFILICYHAWAIETDDNFLARETSRRIGTRKTKLEDFLERLKSSIRNGDSNLGIPSLDPFTVDNVPIDISVSRLINFRAFLTNVRIEGLSSYNVNNADIKLISLKANLNLNWPLIVGSTNYSIGGNAFRLEVHGQGEIDAAAHDFRFQTDVNLALKDQHVQIKTMSINMSLKALDFHITGLFKDDETSKIVSKAISNMVPKLLSNKEVVDIVQQIILKIANNILKTIKVADLMKLLG